MRVRLLLWLGLLLASHVASATELVRVRVSQFTGAETTTVSSASDPTLFVLDDAIASAELTAVNPAAPDKNDHVPWRWFPVLTPAPPAVTAGYIQLSITRAMGQALRIGAISFRNDMVSLGNPSSLVLEWSQDAFTSPLRVIDTRHPTGNTVGLSQPPTMGVTSFRWVAGNDFGESGGGEVGFRQGDVVVYSALCTAEPAPFCYPAQHASLHLENSLDPSRRRLMWSWSRGTARRGDFGTPSLEGGLALCIYDARGLVYEGAAGAQLCGKKSCWKTRPNGLSYRSKGGNASGVSALKIKMGEPNGAISLAGEGEALPELPMSTASGVRTQLVQIGGGHCWESTFETAPSVNTPTEFEAEQTLPPA